MLGGSGFFIHAFSSSQPFLVHEWQSAMRSPVAPTTNGTAPLSSVTRLSPPRLLHLKLWCSCGAHTRHIRWSWCSRQQALSCVSICTGTLCRAAGSMGDAAPSSVSACTPATMEAFQLQVRWGKPRCDAQNELVTSFPVELEVRDGAGHRDFGALWEGGEGQRERQQQHRKIEILGSGLREKVWTCTRRSRGQASGSNLSATSSGYGGEEFFCTILERRAL